MQEHVHLRHTSRPVHLNCKALVWDRSYGTDRNYPVIPRTVRSKLQSAETTVSDCTKQCHCTVHLDRCLTVSLQFRPKTFFSFATIVYCTQGIEYRPTLIFHAIPCWALLRAVLAPTQLQGRSGKHFVASALRGAW